jgi:hypothetical protein
MRAHGQQELTIVDDSQVEMIEEPAPKELRGPPATCLRCGFQLSKGLNEMLNAMGCALVLLGLVAGAAAFMLGELLGGREIGKGLGWISAIVVILVTVVYAGIVQRKSIIWKCERCGEEYPRK